MYTIATTILEKACITVWEIGGILDSLAREGPIELDGGAVQPLGNPPRRETEEGAETGGLVKLANWFLISPIKAAILRCISAIAEDSEATTEPASCLVTTLVTVVEGFTFLLESNDFLCLR